MWHDDDEAKVIVCQVFIPCVFCFITSIRERTECPQRRFTHSFHCRDNRGHYLLSECYLNELCICNFKCGLRNKYNTDLILWFVPVFQIPVPQDHLKNKKDTNCQSSCIIVFKFVCNSVYLMYVHKRGTVFDLCSTFCTVLWLFREGTGGSAAAEGQSHYNAILPVI